jgi:hypothetical protein
MQLLVISPLSYIVHSPVIHLKLDNSNECLALVLIRANE